MIISIPQLLLDTLIPLQGIKQHNVAVCQLQCKHENLGKIHPKENYSLFALLYIIRIEKTFLNLLVYTIREPRQLLIILVAVLAVISLFVHIYMLFLRIE